MKLISLNLNYLFLVFMLNFSTTLTHAQTSGEVVYKCTLKDNANFYRDTLLFQGSNILYIERRNYQEWKSKEGYTFYVQAENSKWYFDINTRNNTYGRYDFKKNKFLYTTDTLKINDWKILNEYKTIGKYKVQKAHLKIVNEYGTFDKYAWFTTELPIQAGPDRKWGLPGLILELRLNGVCTCTMESMVMKPVGDITYSGNTALKTPPKKAVKNKKKLNTLLNKD